MNSFIFGKNNDKIVLKDEPSLKLNQTLNQLKQLTIKYIFDKKANNILSWIKSIKTDFSNKTSNKKQYNRIKKEIQKNLYLSVEAKIHILTDKNNDLLQKCAYYLAINQLLTHHNNIYF